MIPGDSKPKIPALSFPSPWSLPCCFESIASSSPDVPWVSWLQKLGMKCIPTNDTGSFRQQREPFQKEMEPSSNYSTIYIFSKYSFNIRGWYLVGFVMMTFFSKQVYLWGSLLEKNRLDTLLGALGLVGRGFGPAGRVGLGWAWGLAVLGALAGLGVVLGVLCVGRGVWLCWARWLGWAWCWACWARWLGWAWCWAWGLAVLGALAGLGVVLGALAGLGVVLGVGFGRAGRAGWVGRGVGRAGRAGWVGRGVGRAGRAGWVGRAVGRGVWPCLARWLGWAWCWAPGLAVLGALAGLGVVLGVGFGRAGRAGWVGRDFKVQKYTLEIQK